MNYLIGLICHGCENFPVKQCFKVLKPLLHTGATMQQLKKGLQCVIQTVYFYCFSFHILLESLLHVQSAARLWQDQSQPAKCTDCLFYPEFGTAEQCREPSHLRHIQHQSLSQLTVSHITEYFTH